VALPGALPTSSDSDDGQARAYLKSTRCVSVVAVSAGWSSWKGALCLEAHPEAGPALIFSEHMVALSAPANIARTPGASLARFDIGG
jgi:hypothetical protein